MKKIMLIVAILGLSPMLAQADVQLNMALGQFLKSNSSPLSLNSTVALLADANNDGFGDLTTATTNWTTGSDNILLGRFGTNDFLGEGSAFQALSYSYTGLSVGDPLMLVWYDVAFNPSSTGPGEGTKFGSFRTNDVLDGSDIGWLNPADGATVNLNFVTQALEGSLPNNLGITQFQTLGTQVVPEPISTTLALLGGGAMFLRRRFNNLKV